MAVLAADDEEFTVETRVASPADLLIKIESFSLLSKNGIQKYESGEFESGGYKWRLAIHLGGLRKSKNEDNHISVCLIIVKGLESGSKPDVGWEVNAAFNIFLYNHILDNYLCFQGKVQRFHALKSQWGFSKLISKKSLKDPANGFLVDDTCVFGAEVFVIKTIKTQRIVERVSVLDIKHPYKRYWLISNFSKLVKVWISPEFTVGDHKWNIKLYPNGKTGEEGRSVSMYLCLIGAKSFASHGKVKVDYHLRIKNQLNDEHLSKKASEWFTPALPVYGWPAFIPLSDIRDSKKGFVVEDSCIVGVEVSVKAVVS